MFYLCATETLFLPVLSLRISCGGNVNQFKIRRVVVIVIIINHELFTYLVEIICGDVWQEIIGKRKIIGKGVFKRLL